MTRTGHAISPDARVLVAIAGAGTVGSGIAQVVAAGGDAVLLYDRQPGAAAAGRQRIADSLARQVEREQLGKPDAEAILARVTVADSAATLANAEVVIEAIVEDLGAKRALLAELASQACPEALLATNTSSISISAKASVLPNPDRVVGLHFFNPAPAMRLVEIVIGLETSRATQDAAVTLARRWSKQPIVVQSFPGFVVNRVARPFYGEALRMAEEQFASFAEIDTILRDCGGFRMGPFELMDLIGLDVNLAVTRSIFAGYGYDRRYAPSVLQQEYVSACRLGRKSGRGFYTYAGDQSTTRPAPKIPNSKPRAGLPDRVGEVILSSNTGRTARALAVEHGRPTVVVDIMADCTTARAAAMSRSPGVTNVMASKVEEAFADVGMGVHWIDDRPGLIVGRIVAMLANEAADAILAGVATPQDIDLGMRLGTGYPLGPVEWARRLGPPVVVSIMEALAEHYGHDRHRPSPLLRRWALDPESLPP